MSHVTSIRTVPILDLAALETAVTALGGTLHKGKTTYNWFGRHVGDYKLPKGMTADEMGKCVHAASFPGINYQVGFVAGKADDAKAADGSIIPGAEGLFPIFDFWGGGAGTHDGSKLQSLVGANSARLMQEYSKAAVVNAAEAQGYQVAGCTVDAQGNHHLQLLVM